jgi:hypothetical protein
MINIKPKIERPYWNSPTPTIVGDYLKRLKQYKKKLKEFSWEMRDFISDDWYKEIKRAIDTEIEYHEFYFELRKKRKGDYKKWKFIKGFKKYGWNSPKDRWEISNGKIKIIIEIENKKSTYINLIIENDSKYIHFSPDGRSKEISTKILRIPKKINEYIEELKNSSEELFEEYKNPIYNEELRNVEYLQEILK